MSLILDALRKLERDKGSYEPGVLVVGSVPWGETSRTRRLAVWAGAALVLALAVLAGWLLRRSPAPAATAHPTSTAAPVPLPSVAPAPVMSPPLPAPPAQGAYVPPPIRLAPSVPSAAEPTPAPAPAPAQPAMAPSSPTSDEPRLTAISQRDGKPVALINDRLLFEGDSVEGIHVIRIGETEVEIEFKGQRRVLRF